MDDLKARVDTFRRRLEALIADGRYTPTCTPGEWWSLWARVEADLGIVGNPHG